MCWLELDFSVEMFELCIEYWSDSFWFSPQRPTMNLFLWRLMGWPCWREWAGSKERELDAHLNS